MQQGRLARPRCSSGDNQPARSHPFGQCPDELGGQSFPPVEHLGLRLVERHQAAVGAPLHPSGAGIRPALHRRRRGGITQFERGDRLPGQPSFGQLPHMQLDAQAAFGIQPIESFQDLRGGPFNAGEQKSHFAEPRPELRHHRNDVIVNPLAAGIDRGSQHDPARVDFFQHGRYLGAQQGRMIISGCQELLDPRGQEPLRFLGREPLFLFAEPVDRGDHNIAQHIPADGRQHPDARRNHVSAPHRRRQDRCERGSTQQRQQDRGRKLTHSAPVRVPGPEHPLPHAIPHPGQLLIERIHGTPGSRGVGFAS